MEKAHNVSSVHRLTLEASQRRTKLSQSSCPPWVSGLSSGFIKLLRKGTHQGRLSPKAVGAWPGAHLQLQLRKSALSTACISVRVRTCEDGGAGLGGGPGQKAQTGSRGKKHLVGTSHHGQKLEWAGLNPPPARLALLLNICV